MNMPQALFTGKGFSVEGVSEVGSLRPRVYSLLRNGNGFVNIWGLRPPFTCMMHSIKAYVVYLEGIFPMGKK